ERLGDSVRVGGQGLDETGLPEYMCGGAHSRPQPSSLQRRRRHGGPSNHTGRQTTRKRKAGSRVTVQGTFNGVGRALDEHVEDESIKKAGAGFRKQAGSKKAREAHAIAAERRLLALQSQTAEPASSSSVDLEDSDSESDSLTPETDQDRRQTLLDSDANAERLTQTTLDAFIDDFLMPCTPACGTSAAVDDCVLIANTSSERTNQTIWHVPSVVHLEVKVTGKGCPNNMAFNLKFMPQERSGILTCTLIYAVIGVFDLSTVNVNS
ncbi:hypothetical protein BC835DRAFT_1419085, partial [Cytidiella melzeri]